ncbi:MAG: type II toxin-antitoxin system RatA family toxin [Rickettsiales bacterium]|jgi:coenzyme Q-binding protein COQ10|nr:type II toxin-antitoxin system RatA family toxin [Rickettsiales bacterium]
MPKLVRNISAPYDAKFLFDLVADIESYPEFLPWCVAARINDRKNNIIYAELVIKYKLFRSSYVSKVTLIPNKEIVVELADGPFKNLQNHWKFTPNANGVDAEFMLDFTLKSKILNNIISNEFDYYSNKLIDAFLKRAALIHKETSNS